LDACEVDILCNRSKLGVHTNVSSKLMNLDVKYNYMLVEVGSNLVALDKELKSPSSVILMF